ncbi:MAG TPA: Clp protease N-terminal domain-containing protein [Ktedonobacterales bacterium]
MDGQPGRFDKFTERARKVLSLAQEEALRFNHNYIGTEHLLLGLIREQDGTAAKALKNLGVELNKVRAAVEFIIGRGDQIVLGDVGLTPRSRKVIELAVDEARRLGHRSIGTEHLLLGIVREGVASGVLESLGANLEMVRAEVARLLDMSVSPSDELLSSLFHSPDRGAWLKVAAQPEPQPFGALTFICRDVAATAAYYMDYLGATELDDPESTLRYEIAAERLLRLPFHAPLLALRSAPQGADEAERNVIGAIGLDFFTSEVGAIWVTLQARDAPGVSPLTAVPGATDRRMFTLTDPDGRKLRIHSAINT